MDFFDADAITPPILVDVSVPIAVDIDRIALHPLLDVNAVLRKDGVAVVNHRGIVLIHDALDYFGGATGEEKEDYEKEIVE